MEPNDIRDFPNAVFLAVKMRLLLNLLKSSTIVLFNLAEYRLILFHWGYRLASRRYSSLPKTSLSIAALKCDLVTFLQ